MLQKRVYADWAATSPLCPQAVKSMMEAMEIYGNPSSLHADGVAAKEIVEKARKQVADLINAEPEEIYFTSGATESNVWALKGEKFPLVSCIEHSSILKRPGLYPTFLPVNRRGEVFLPDKHKYMDMLPSMVSVMAVNNETGVIQNVKYFCEWAHENNMWFHTDATQAVGHIPVDVKELGCDLLSMSAHKFGGPKGVGALYIKNGYEKRPMMYGGGQESGLRGGTENVIGIAGMGGAAEFYKDWEEEHSSYSWFLQKRLEEKVLAVYGVLIAGFEASRSNSITDFLFEGIEGPAMVLALDKRGVSASSGSACSEGEYGPSHVIKAMGLEKYGSLRISLGWRTTVQDVDDIAEAISESVKGLRG